MCGHREDGEQSDFINFNGLMTTRVERENRQTVF